MKHWRIISLILGSALLASCGKDLRIEATGGPIGFSAEMSVATRGLKPEDQTVLIHDGSEVSIFGTRVYNDEPETVFSNRTLTCDAQGAWTYTPVEYWETTGDYYFSAVFPYSNDRVSIDNTYALNVNYSAGDNTDMMVARTHQDAAQSTAPVNLLFKHTTAAVRFLFGKASSENSDQYTLTSFQLENLVPSGVFSMATRVTGSPTIEAGNWAVTNIRTTLFPWTADTPEERKVITHPSDSNDPDGYTAMGWYYMVPHTLSAEAAVRFSVSYNGGTPVETVLNFYRATDQNSEEGTAWLPNCVYNYFITLNQSGLNLTVQAVPWDQVLVTTDDVIFE